ncbi:cysteine desulfurase-like protein [Sphaerisporangium flaviroseum]|uniref:Cysteine desulfurase-like protein n=1 Tax=Sphaerisporangium flaviroseum TaxID=509199 RepID=A0ABP7HVG9_9ACTN
MTTDLSPGQASEPTTPPLDLESVRQQFPALQRSGEDGTPIIYADAPGGTQVPQRVVQAMTSYLIETNSNIEGEYAASIATDQLILKAREYGGSFVNGDPVGVAFGQNMTTLNFLLTRAIGRTLEPGDEILTTTLDHDANVAPWLLLAEDRGLVVRQVGVTDDLRLDLDDLAAKLTPRTRVVAFTLASNAIGSVSDARQATDLAHQAGALAWVDAVAYAAHRRIDVKSIGCDVVLCSPYKFFGPHMGMAWIRPDLAETLPAERVRPAGILPPGHRFETGTLSHEALAGFVAAVDHIASLGGGEDLTTRLTSAYRAISAHEGRLAERFLDGLGQLSGWRLFGPAKYSPTQRVATFGLLGSLAPPSSLARQLAERQVYAWNGNFYALDLVRHLGVDIEEGLLRLGFCHYNTVEEVDAVLGHLSEMSGS